MERANKETMVKAISAKFERMTSAVFLDFKGLDVATVSKLRDEFRKSGVEYKVIKNTLIKHAIKSHAWAKNLDKSLVGMTGVAFSYEDPSAAAKVVKQKGHCAPWTQILHTPSPDRPGGVGADSKEFFLWLRSRVKRSSTTSPRCPSSESSRV